MAGQGPLAPTVCRASARLQHSRKGKDQGSSLQYTNRKKRFIEALASADEMKHISAMNQTKFAESLSLLRRFPSLKVGKKDYDLEEQRPDENVCFGRQRYNHMRGNPMMFCPIRRRIKDANNKFYVTVGTREDGYQGYLLNPVVQKTRSVEEKSEELHLPDEARETDAESDKDGDEEEASGMNEEEEIKVLPSSSHKSNMKSVPTSHTPEPVYCWLDSATVSSITQHSSTVRDSQPKEFLPSQDFKQSIKQSDSETVPSSVKDTHGGVPEEAQPPPPERMGSLAQVPETRKDTSSMESERNVEEEIVEDIEPIVPGYICPSSVEKSRIVEIKKWLSKSHFAATRKTLPMM